MPRGHKTQVEPKFLPDKPAKPLAEKLLAGTAICSGIMLGLAMPGLIGTESWLDVVKAVVITGSAIIVSYGATRLATDRAADLAAINFKGALAGSICVIGLVGTGLWSATYAGLTIGKVEERQLDGYGRALENFTLGQIERAQSASRLVPALKAAQSDLKNKAECERLSGCVSGRAQGRGPVAKSIEERSVRAGQVATSFVDGEAKRDRIAGELAAHLASYRQTLNVSGMSIGERRIRLQKVVTDIGRSSVALQEAVPVALASSFARELSSGIDVPGVPDAARTLSDAFRAHASAIENAVSKDHTVTLQVPPMPSRPGVASTFNYIGDFWPIAAITAVADLGLPLFAFYLGYLGLYWNRYRAGEAAPRFEQHVQTPSSVIVPIPDQPESTDGSVTPIRRGRKPAGGVS